MELIHVVQDEDAKLARSMEEKLLRLPKNSGVLFAGVSVEPGSPNSLTTFHVWIGCSRDVDPRMIPALVEVALYQEVKAGKLIRTVAKMGTIRS